MTMTPGPSGASPETYAQHLSTAHLTKNLRRGSVRDAAVMVTALAATFFNSTGDTAVLACLLGPRDLGLIGMVATFTRLLAFFVVQTRYFSASYCFRDNVRSMPASWWSPSDSRRSRRSARGCSPGGSPMHSCGAANGGPARHQGVA